MDEARVKEALQLCTMMDSYIAERTNVIANLTQRMLPLAENDEDKANVLYVIGKLTEELSFIRFSAFSFVNQLYEKNKDFSFWLRG